MPASQREIRTKLQQRAKVLKNVGLIDSKLNTLSRQQLEQTLQTYEPFFFKLTQNERKFMRTASNNEIRQRHQEFLQRGLSNPNLRKIKEIKTSLIEHYPTFRRINRNNISVQNMSRKMLQDQLRGLKEQGYNVGKLNRSNFELRKTITNISLEDRGNQAEELAVDETQNFQVNAERVPHSSEWAKSYKITTEPLTADFLLFGQTVHKQIRRKIKKNLKENGVRVQIKVKASFYRSSDPEVTMEGLFTSSDGSNSAVTILRRDQIDDAISELLNRIQNMIERHQNGASDWVITSVNELFLNIAEFNPITGGCSEQKLPKAFKNRGVVQLEGCKDGECGLYAILAGLHYDDFESKKKVGRASIYHKFRDEIKLGQGEPKIEEYEVLDEPFTVKKGQVVEFPISISDMNTIEKLNPWLTINVYSVKLNEDESKIISHRILRSVKPKEHHVNLLLLHDHWFPIVNFNRFMGATKWKNRREFCLHCLQMFHDTQQGKTSKEKTAKQKLKEHHELGCYNNDGAKPILPKKGEHHLKFTNFHCQLKLPVTVYADIECSLIPKDETKGQTKLEYEHVPNSIGARVVSEPFPELVQTKVFYDTEEINCIAGFLHWLDDLENKVSDRISSRYVALKMRDGDEEAFQSAVSCHACGGTLGTDRVRDHDHFTGKYRGACHNKCNLHKHLHRKWKLPVIFHNLKGYDSHLLVSEVARVGRDCNKQFDALPMNNEKFISFSMGRMRFIDSMSFLNGSLEKLTENLKTKGVGGDVFRNLYEEFGDYPQESLDLLTQKGVYPYSYMDGDPERFELEELPSRQQFYDNLKEEHIGEKEYQHALQVWDAFKCQTFRDYHELYLKTDVLLLADVFESFRELSLNNYMLDPCWFFGSPGLSWEAFLLEKGNKYDLELFHQNQYDMFLFTEKAKRGGISIITHRYARANNLYLKDYDENKETSYIMYYDCSNLYGWAMRQNLPIGGFCWRDDLETFTEDYIKRLDPENDDEGYFIEVDLEYPERLHDLHSDYPLAVENTTGQYSPYMIDKAEKIGVSTESTEIKLVPTLNDKEGYICHSANLKQYLELGLRIKRVKRVLAFQQAPVMRSYIDKNTELRKHSKDDFEKDLFKLMNNSVFGKTMENVRGYSNIHFCTTRDKFMKYSSLPTFKGFTIIDENLVATDNNKEFIQFAKPIFLGASILDISKTKMIDFHYNHIKDKYGNNARLLFSDTDSLCYHIETEDVYRDMENEKWRFDLSDFQKDHFLHDETNKKVVGTFKDEACDGKNKQYYPIREFVGLRPKMYSFIKDDETVDKKAKGIPKKVADKLLSHEKYIRALGLEDTPEILEFNSINSYNHKVVSCREKKQGLSPLDDKFYVLEDGISTIPHGHYKLKNHVNSI